MTSRPAIRRSGARLLAAACTLFLPGAAGLCAAGSAPTPAPAGLPASITGEIPREAAPSPVTPIRSGEEIVPTKVQPVRESHPAPQAEASAPSLDPQSLTRQKVNDQFAALLALARRAVAKHDAAAAEVNFDKALTLPVPTVDKRAALRQMAAFYRERKMLAKAAAVSEKTLALAPNDPDNPSLYFELGKTYLDAGMYDLAISRFYSVLNSAISQADGAEGTKTTRNLSLLAQFEIAEASYAKGDFAAAAKFYARIGRLDLPGADRPTVAFKGAQSLFQLGDYQAAAAALRGFIDTCPTSPFNPEARNLLARSFQKLKRPEDATEAVLALLRQEKKSGDPTNLARWQRETGKQIAARFYEEGEIHSALTIYQTLATLDPSPEWQWPVVYQIGLCFERLNLPDRARQVYDFLQGPQAGRPNAAGDKLPPALDAIRGMAKWREDHLAWQQNSGAQLQVLLGSLHKGPATDADPAPPPPLSAPAVKPPTSASSPPSHAGAKP